MQQQRIEYIDTAKAIGIILVILGHCHFVGTVFRLGIWIYSFHMPLFFIISGMFIKPLDFKNGLNKYSMAYLKPYVVACLLMFILSLCLFYGLSKGHSPVIVLEGIAFGKGSQEWFGLFHDLPDVGPIWFLLALFWGGQFYSIIKASTGKLFETILLCFSLFFLGYMTSKYVVLPLSFQAGLCSIPFLLIGDLLKNRTNMVSIMALKKSHIGTIMLVWLYAVLVMKDDLNMASCRYDEGVVRIPISILATIVTLYACKQINKKGIKLKWLGSNTLCVLVGHQIFTFFCKEIAFDFAFLAESLPRPLPLFVEFTIQIVMAMALGIVIKKIFNL